MLPKPSTFSRKSTKVPQGDPKEGHAWQFKQKSRPWGLIHIGSEDFKEGACEAGVAGSWESERCCLDRARHKLGGPDSASTGRMAVLLKGDSADTQPEWTPTEPAPKLPDSRQAIHPIEIENEKEKS